MYFIEKFHWESGFIKFRSRDYFRKTKIRFFGRYFETEHFLNVLCADLWSFYVYTDMVQVSYRNSCGTQKWLDPSGPPCAQTGVKSSLGT